MVVQQQEEASQGTLSVNLLPPHLKTRLREIPSPTSWANMFFDLCNCENTGYGHLASAGICQAYFARSTLSWREWVAGIRSYLQEAGSHQSSPCVECIGVSPTLFCHLWPTQWCRYLLHTLQGDRSCPCPLAPLQLPTQTQPTQFKQWPAPVRCPESLLHICISWNKGYCTYPGMCMYKHICAT